MRRYKSIRGSIVVEAAIFLPIFLVGVLTLGFLIRQAGTEETALHAVLNQARLAGVTAYSSLQQSESAEDGDGDGLYGTAVGLGSRQLFRVGVQTQLSKEIGLDEECVTLRHFRYLYETEERDHLIEATVRYTLPIPLPRGIRDSAAGEAHVVLRAFIGREEKRRPAAAEELEAEKESCIVYIFPRSGERYHSAGCTVVTSTPVRCILTEGLKRKYEPCSLCDSGAIGRGSIVYCYTGYGAVYHRGDCKAVDKYVAEIEKDEALERGYLPCQKCGG